LGHGDVIDRAVIGAGEESGRKRAAQRDSGLENNSEPSVKTLLVYPDKPERHLQCVAASSKMPLSPSLAHPGGGPAILAPPSDISDGTFKPGMSITRAEAAQALYAAIKDNPR
jgi:hypothetical protein